MTVVVLMEMIVFTILIQPVKYIMKSKHIIKMEQEETETLIKNINIIRHKTDNIKKNCKYIGTSTICYICKNDMLYDLNYNINEQICNTCLKEIYE